MSDFQHCHNCIIHTHTSLCLARRTEGQMGNRKSERDNWHGVARREGQREMESKRKAVILIVDELAFPVAAELSEALRKVQDC